MLNVPEDANQLSARVVATVLGQKCMTTIFTNQQFENTDRQISQHFVRNKLQYRVFIRNCIKKVPFDHLQSKFIKVKATQHQTTMTWKLPKEMTARLRQSKGELAKVKGK